MDCLICEREAADKTGSHIIPHSILESYLNETGVTGRDKGISFRIGEKGSDFKLGRSVIPETQEKFLGREATQEEINESIAEQHHVEDYVFCSSCEKKLSHLESLYKSDIVGSIIKGNQLSPEQVKIFQFFWLSVILRCSASKKLNFTLMPDLEAQVRDLLNTILSDTVKETHDLCLAIPFPYKLQVFANVTAPNKNHNCILLHPGYKNPYLLFINEYVLLFEFTDELQIEELTQYLHITTSPRHTGLSYVSDKDWVNIRAVCQSIKAKQFYRDTIAEFIKQYTDKHATRPNDVQVKAFSDELTSDDPKIEEATKWSEERIKRLFGKYSE